MTSTSTGSDAAEGRPSDAAEGALSGPAHPSDPERVGVPSGRSQGGPGPDDVPPPGGLPGPVPQPLGVLPWPAGLLVLPPSQHPDAAAAAAALLEGKTPRDLPPEWAFLRAALDGDAAGAADLLDGAADLPGTAPATAAGMDRWSEGGLVAAYNRAVLLGGVDVWPALAAAARGDLAALVETARFSVGDVDDPPAGTAVRGEVAAVAGSARASAALEAGDPAVAVDELAMAASAAAAAGSPVLAATLSATRAELQRDRLGQPAAAAATADAALGALPVGTAAEVRAELLLTRALARQETAGADRAPLMTVVADLQEALRTFREDTHPEQFATCNEHLALAYLVLPMGQAADKIRIGTAVTALRAALRVFRPKTHPVAWASAQLNLANALQYLPSVHQERNLDEAVQLYEELLRYRDADTDPLGTARILANQGNALGHLGVFSDARERLVRARDLFAAAGDAQSAADVGRVLEGLDAAEAAAGARGAAAPADPVGGA